jgi:hypothetical protein
MTGNVGTKCPRIVGWQVVNPMIAAEDEDESEINPAPAVQAGGALDSTEAMETGVALENISVVRIVEADGKVRTPCRVVYLCTRLSLLVAYNYL